MRLRNGVDQGPGLAFVGEVRAPVSAPRTNQAGSARTIVEVSRGIRSRPSQNCAGPYPLVRIVLGQFRFGPQLVQSSHRENVDLAVKKGDLDPVPLLNHSSYPAVRMMARRLDALLLNDVFSVTVSLRALISLDAIFRSFAQAGSRPFTGLEPFLLSRCQQRAHRAL